MTTLKPTLEQKAAMRAAKVCHTLALRAETDSDRRTAYTMAAEMYEAAGSWAMARHCEEMV